MEQGPVSSFLSTGFCGGLDPELNVSDVFVAEKVVGDGGQRWDVSEVHTGDQRAARGLLLSRDEVVITKDDKRSLFRSLGARAVEMEAAAVAQMAHQNGVPFYCIRVVSDAASDGLPLDFNQFRAPSGRFRRGRILGAVLAHPSSIRGLLRLNTNSLRAARSLGDFLVHCQF